VGQLLRLGHQKVLFSINAYSIPDIYWLAALGPMGHARALEGATACRAMTEAEALDGAGRSG
jgi:hypothetical protein